MLSTTFLRRGSRLAIATALTLLLTLAALDASPALAADPTLTVNRTGGGTVTSDPAGINCGSDCSEAYPVDSQEVCEFDPETKTNFCYNEPIYEDVALTASTPTGWSFGGWGGECSGTGSCTVTMDADKTVSASWSDVQNPSVSLTSPTGPYVSGTINLTATASDNDRVTRVEFRVNSSLVDTDTTAPYSTSYNTTAVSDGSKEFRATAFDDAGRTATASRSVMVDNTNPTLEITGGPNGETFAGGSTQTWTFTASDGTGSGVQSVQCSVVSAGSTPSYGPCSGGSSHSVSGRPEGSHTFYVKARDLSGRETVRTRNFSIDATPPDTTIQNKPNNPTNSTSANFTYTSNDPNSTFQCRLDGPSNAHGFTSCNQAGKSYSNLADGSYTFLVKARDQVGNEDQTPANHTWTVDTTGPAASITGGPNEGQVRSSGTETFTFTGAEPGGGYQCSMDSTTNFLGCSSGQSFNVADGTHTFRVKAADGLGNFGPAASRTWTADTTAPTLNITEGPDDETFKGGSTQTWKFNAGDATSGVDKVQCSVVAAGSTRSFSLCDSQSEHSETGLSAGTYEFAVKVTDRAGHETDQKRTFSIDTTSPTVETWNPKGKKVKPTAKPFVTFSEAMDEGSVEASANGKPTTFVLKKGTTVIPASVTYTESGTTFKAVLTPNKKLKAGAKYTATVTTAAKDKAGNALVAKSWKFTVKKR